MNTIKSNTKLTAKSICDHNCIFTLTVIERNPKSTMALIQYKNEVKRSKIYVDIDGNEYLMPDKYSMAPIFRAN